MNECLSIRRILSWCAKDGDVEWVDCTQCPFFKSDDHCQYSYTSQSDAVSMADRIRVAQGRPLLSNDFGAMKLSLATRNFKQREIKGSEVRQVEQDIVPSDGSASDIVDYWRLGACILGSLALGFPLAYIGVVLQIFTELFFGFFDVMLGTSDPWGDLSKPEEANFFYATYEARYVYWSALSLLVAVWCGGHYKDGKSRGDDDSAPIVEICVSFLFGVIAFLNFNLFISTIIGPIFLLFSLFATAKRR